MVSVTLNGAPIDALVLAEQITVRVGRRNILDGGEPGSAALTLQLDAWDPAITVGARITVTDRNSRFDGVVSDSPRSAWVEHPDDSARWLLIMRILCAGPLARWGRDRIGDEPWPAETVAARAARIAALVGAPLDVQGGTDLRVIGRDVDSRPAVDVLEDLATDASGWLYDHQGRTVLQSLDARRHGDPQERWDDQTTTWDAWQGTWDEQGETSPAFPRTVILPPDAVLFAPSWQQNSVLANDVEVFFGPVDEETGAQASVVASDTASITQWTRHSVSVRTRLEQSADAQLRAALVIERAAQPLWYLPSVDVAWELLDEPTAAQLDDMLPGVRCQVSMMPLPGPASAFDGCVEGWTEQWAWDDVGERILRTTTLHLSDVRWSFAVLTWDEITPDTLTWDQIDPATSWDQILTADDLQLQEA